MDYNEDDVAMAEIIKKELTEFIAESSNPIEKTIDFLVLRVAKLERIVIKHGLF